MSIFKTLTQNARRGQRDAVAAQESTARFLANRTKIPLKLARNMINTDAPDGEVLLNVRAQVEGRPRRAAANFGRARSRVEAVRAILVKECGGVPAVSEYLDIGCSEGDLTTELGALFSAEKVHGCDVRAVADAAFEFRQGSAESLEYADGQFGAVSFVMTLHHVKNVEKALSEARRVLAPGGVLVVREHDCPGENFGHYLDAVHYIYAVVGNEIEFDSPAGFEKHLPKFATRYATRKMWAGAIAAAGFEPVGRSMAAAHGRPDKYRGYFEVFVAA